MLANLDNALPPLVTERGDLLAALSLFPLVCSILHVYVAVLMWRVVGRVNKQSQHMRPQVIAAKIRTGVLIMAVGSTLIAAMGVAYFVLQLDLYAQLLYHLGGLVSMYILWSLQQNIQLSLPHH